MPADIGLIGLAVMGQNLVLNMRDHGYSVAVYNRSGEVTKQFMEEKAENTGSITPTFTVEDLVDSLKHPRMVMLMIKAGDPVDQVIENLLPLLDEGDIIIDGGNSHFRDTIRRSGYIEDHGMLYVGTGISGGEEGARHGPSIMPGGSPDAWEYVKPILQDIAAEADGEPCADWVGPDGAGHFVKMVHNGIEYGDMQLISEAYHLMQTLGLSTREMSEVFGTWNEGVLDSYLIEITRDIFTVDDEETGEPLVDVILDSAGQKGTGKWASILSLEFGQPVTLIGEAVFARFLSALKDERDLASTILTGPSAHLNVDREAFLDEIHDALYASKIVSYAQGFQLMQAAGQKFNWDLDLGNIAMLWREGCIIRSQFLGRIKDAYEESGDLTNLLLHDYFRSALQDAQPGWRDVVANAAYAGIPVPAFGAALAYYDGYRQSRLPANLIQAQRDFFGAHTYERLDRPRGEFFHTDWGNEKPG